MIKINKYFEQPSTVRLYFRKLNLTDAENWIGFFENNSNLKYLNLDLRKTTSELALEWVETQIHRYKNSSLGQLGIFLKDNDVLVGTIGFIDIDTFSPLSVIKATAIHPAFWSKGIATEASIALLSNAFLDDSIYKVVGYRHIKNTKSALFNRSLGFKDVGVLKQSSRDVVKYEITRNEWLSKYLT